MGKTLVIKGADFALNAINASWQEGQLFQAYVNTNNTSTSYGMIYTTGVSVPNLILGKIFIPAHTSMLIEVKNNGVRMTGLLISYNGSPNNVAIVDRDIISNISANLHPVTDSIRNSDGTFTITNSTNVGLYYYLNFTYDTTAGPAIPVTGKKLYYQPV